MAGLVEGEGEEKPVPLRGRGGAPQRERERERRGDREGEKPVLLRGRLDGGKVRVRKSGREMSFLHLSS
jgi:hypothetical protein